MYTWLKTLPAFILFCILLICSSPSSAFISQEGGFSVWMPNEPTLKEIIHKSFAGNVIEKTYISKTDYEEFIVSYSELPNIALSTQSTKALLTRAKEGFLKDTRAQELSFEKFSVLEKQGRELSFRIVSKENIISAVGKARFLLVNKIMYVMVATETNYDEENKIINQFLNSFKLF